MPSIGILVSWSHPVEARGQRAEMALEMELTSWSETSVPTGTGEEPICIVAEGVSGKQLGIEVHLPAPKSVVGVQTEQICVFVIAVPQSAVMAMVLDGLSSV